MAHLQGVLRWLYTRNFWTIASQKDCCFRRLESYVQSWMQGDSLCLSLARLDLASPVHKRRSDLARLGLWFPGNELLRDGHILVHQIRGRASPPKLTGNFPRYVSSTERQASHRVRSAGKHKESTSYCPQSSFGVWQNRPSTVSFPDVKWQVFECLPLRFVVFEDPKGEFSPTKPDIRKTFFVERQVMAAG